MSCLFSRGVPSSVLIKVVNLWILRDHTLTGLVRGPLGREGFPLLV